MTTAEAYSRPDRLLDRRQHGSAALAEADPEPAGGASTPSAKSHRVSVEKEGPPGPSGQGDGLGAVQRHLEQRSKRLAGGSRDGA